MSESLYLEILDLLQKQFPGKLLLCIDDVSSIYGIVPGTIRNQLSRNARKKFPVQPIRRGGHPRFRIHDIAKDLSSKEQ